MCEVYREQYGAEPKIEAIHAGLECGLLCESCRALIAFPSARSCWRSRPASACR